MRMLSKLPLWRSVGSNAEVVAIEYRRENTTAGSDFIACVIVILVSPESDVMFCQVSQFEIVYSYTSSSRNNDASRLLVAEEMDRRTFL